MAKPRVFLDSSVLIAAVLSPTGGSTRVLADAEGHFAFVINDYVLDELRGILATKFGRQPELSGRLHLLLGLAGVAVLPDPSFRAVRAAARHISRNDAPIFASALAASDYLLTLDNEFLADRVRDIAAKHHLVVLKPGDFIARFFT